MGKPGRSHVLSSTDEYIVCMKPTQGSETSQYLKERKSNETPKVAASEMGRAQTGWIRSFGVVGPAHVVRNGQGKKAGKLRQSG